MTSDQIEAAARALCRLRGVDPDSYVNPEAALYTGDYAQLVSLPVPRWKYMTHEVERFAQVGQAIASVIDLPARKKPKKS